MDNLKELPTDQLLELLAQYTSEYTRMVRDGAPHIEYFSCEQMLNQLQVELNFRKASVSSTEFNFETNTSAENNSSEDKTQTQLNTINVLPGLQDSKQDQPS